MSEPNQTLYFGDIHNHNALGYGLGSLERSIEIARTHLDFFAFTGHSSWHDLKPMEGGREKHWLDGFERLRNAWPDVQRRTADANRTGEFAAFLGFEWHSSQYGDQCVVLPDDNHPLVFPNSIADLRRYCVERNGLMIPHHLAYATGHRGVNWDVFDDECTPVVEIFSEHGNAEEDRGPYPYFTHSMGGRVTTNTARCALDRGLRFGFVASSDNHRGFPGAYGEGLMGVWAAELSRTALLDAIRSRRTIALTGDRIGIRFRVDGREMGSAISAGREVEVSYDVDGRDEIDVVELIVNGEVLHRSYPDTAAAKRGDQPGRVATSQLRFEWGWGPWGDLHLERTCDWEFEMAVRGVAIARVFPCLQSGPFDEDRRHLIDRVDANTVRVVSYTARRDAYRQNPNQSLVLELEGGIEAIADATIEVQMRRPVEMSTSSRLAALMDSSAFVPTGSFPAESCLLHRVVPVAASSLSETVAVRLPRRQNYIYVRVRQKNGQMAWGSPVFVSCES